MSDNADMRFVLIRHGQSANNLLYQQTGETVGRHHDPELTELGQTQADRLAQWVGAGGLPWTITHLYCSLMIRAVQTAAPVAVALDLPLHAHPEAFETGGPFVEDDTGRRSPHPGAAASRLREVSPHLMLPELATEDGWHFLEHEQTHEAAAQRAARMIVDLRGRHDDHDVVAVVMHGAYFQHVFRTLLGIQQMTGWIINRNTSITLIEDNEKSHGSTCVAERIDWLPHLSDDLLTI